MSLSIQQHAAACSAAAQYSDQLPVLQQSTDTISHPAAFAGKSVLHLYVRSIQLPITVTILMRSTSSLIHAQKTATVTESQFLYNCLLAKLFHSVLVLFVPQLPKYGTPYRLTFCSLKRYLHLGIVWRPTTFNQPILPPSAHPYNAPWFSSETLALYKSLTYLLT